MDFKLVSQFKPAGHQAPAIKKLMQGLKAGYQDQTLLGVTGSGKTFTIANVVAQINKPTLVISHNKTLAAQLASEFQDFFPENAVHYFVSYYDYYQPEAYIPSSDTYIEKETQINEEIDRLRHVSTQSLLTRRDVLIVASVSCIYNLGNPAEYQNFRINLKVGESYNRFKLLKNLNNLQYHRNDLVLTRSNYTVKGEIIDIFASGQEKEFYRLTFFADVLESIETINLLGHKVIDKPQEIFIFPAKHFMVSPENIKDIVAEIRYDLDLELAEFQKQGKILEAERLKTRVNNDLEMILETGFCNGIENYSRYFDGRQKNDSPNSLMDYFPDDFLLIVDESHMTLPQIGGMYLGDRARKKNLIDFGFRLQAAYDNRPLNFEEFNQQYKQAIYISATPAEYELNKSQSIAEQLVRPTFILDPTIEIRPSKDQLDDLIKEIKTRVAKKERVLVATITKRLSEDLTEILLEKNIKVQYLHSEVKTLDRIQILHDLRSGKYDVLVGVNLLREGLDLPEVSLVAILDADKEGFLRSRMSLIQVMGRAARHKDGRVIMYADNITGSMQAAIDETNRRRKVQEQYNKDNKVEPQSISKLLKEVGLKELDTKTSFAESIKLMSKQEKQALLETLRQEMELSADNWDFEKAIILRDQIDILANNKK
ncbi:MAG: excinuclease ABC subunit UvrB [Patescibacteria group bacterium]|jgi:excinuclease ABC subunit B